MRPDPGRYPRAARPTPPPVFLERQSYRRRRLLDAARLFPTIGAALFAVPLLWPRAGEGGEIVPTSSAILYIFTVWAALIVVTAAFGRLTHGMNQPPGGATSEREADGDG